VDDEDKCRLIPLAEINDPWVLLRTVDTNSVEYLQIRDTIRDKRLILGIAVRPDPRHPGDRHPGKYEVVDGMYRLTAFRELGKDAIPATIHHGMTDEEVLSSQIQANALRRETTPVEYARQMRRIQKHHLESHGTDITLSQMAVMVGQCVDWVMNTLALLNLSREIQQLVERDELKLSNAYMLAKMSPRLQRRFIEHAIQMPVAEFDALATSVIRGVMEAARNGKLEDAFINEFKPIAFLRSLKKVEQEIASHAAGAEYIARTNCTPMQAWDAALRWAAQLDEQSIAKQQKAATKRHKAQRIERDSYQKLIESDSQPDRP
jgi:ParB/RepB/Spo0J family partition protein